MTSPKKIKAEVTDDSIVPPLEDCPPVPVITLPPISPSQKQRHHPTKSPKKPRTKRKTKKTKPVPKTNNPLPPAMIDINVLTTTTTTATASTTAPSTVSSTVSSTATNIVTKTEPLFQSEMSSMVPSVAGSVTTLLPQQLSTIPPVIHTTPNIPPAIVSSHQSNNVLITQQQSLSLPPQSLPIQQISAPHTNASSMAGSVGIPLTASVMAGGGMPTDLDMDIESKVTEENSNGISVYYDDESVPKVSITETGEMLFRPLKMKCTHCDEKYSKTHDLYRHIRSHQNHTECPFCEKKLTCMATFVYHVRTHTAEKPYYCPVEDCDFRNAVKYNLKVHLACVKHGGKENLRKYATVLDLDVCERSLRKRKDNSVHELGSRRSKKRVKYQGDEHRDEYEHMAAELLIQMSNGAVYDPSAAGMTAWSNPNEMQYYATPSYSGYYGTGYDYSMYGMTPGAATQVASGTISMGVESESKPMTQSPMPTNSDNKSATMGTQDATMQQHISSSVPTTNNTHQSYDFGSAPPPINTLPIVSESLSAAAESLSIEQNTILAPLPANSPTESEANNAVTQQMNGYTLDNAASASAAAANSAMYSQYYYGYPSYYNASAYAGAATMNGGYSVMPMTAGMSATTASFYRTVNAKNESDRTQTENDMNGYSPGLYSVDQKESSTTGSSKRETPSAMSPYDYNQYMYQNNNTYHHSYTAAAAAAQATSAAVMTTTTANHTSATHSNDPSAYTADMYYPYYDNTYANVPPLTKEDDDDTGVIEPLMDDSVPQPIKTNAANDTLQ